MMRGSQTAIDRRLIRAAEAMLRRHEGVRQFPYHDSRNKLTIGVGRNLSDRGLDADEIDYLFSNDMALGLRICRNLYPAFDGFNSHRQSALLSMAFNLGQPRLAGFKRMRAAINRENWALAAHEAEHSLWARQTRQRVDEIAGLLRGIV